MIYQKFGKSLKIKALAEESSNLKEFSLSNKKIYSKIAWKPTISIWDGLSLLVHENKFNSKPSMEEFADRIRNLCRQHYIVLLEIINIIKNNNNFGGNIGWNFLPRMDI